jgi:hypothetical protein
MTMHPELTGTTTAPSNLRKYARATGHYLYEQIVKRRYFYGIYIFFSVVELFANHACRWITVHLMHTDSQYAQLSVSWAAFVIGGMWLAKRPLRVTQLGEKFTDPLIGGPAWLYHRPQRIHSRWLSLPLTCLGYIVASGITAGMGMASIVKADGHPHPVRMVFTTTLVFATIWVPGLTIAWPPIWHFGVHLVTHIV